MRKSVIISTVMLCFLLVVGCKLKENDDITPIPTNGLIAYFPFNGNANDESGYKNNGEVIQGVALTADRKLNKDKAYSFGGFDNVGYIKVNNSENMHLTKTLSISIWYKLNSYYGMDSYAKASQNGYHVLIGKEGDRDGFYMAVDNNQAINKQNVAFYNKITFSSNFSILGNPTGTNSENTNKWIHAVTVIDEVNAKLYINGTLIQTTLVSPDFSSANAKNLYIGTMMALGTNWYPFNGSIDDIRIYNRSLSDTEIVALSKE
ncbi:LamG domain-containing protein [Arcicella sp. DC2W]|uniref:LamG domain-containing protein n=1 Tax=Arcicella gelida TaxID=2984195 RepID=A0ABU5S0K0_9BACT|nr:LamG domain-containing protein [Arcicella sp. DC2W]MEA5401957.1 LamG domain-containing protein [Arcicella sp. DC2W]